MEIMGWVVKCKSIVGLSYLPLGHAKLHLGIQINVVVPRQPVAGIQLVVRQGPHLRGGGFGFVNFLDDLPPRISGVLLILSICTVTLLTFT